MRVGVAIAALMLASCATLPVRPLIPEARDWVIEAEDGASKVTFADGEIDIDAPEGLSLWYARPLAGRVSIEFEAMAVAKGGANDAVSDLNAFWMATDPAAPDRSVLARGRSGKFAEYDTLHTYYVGIGGNRNTTTRFRGYTGNPGDRPLLPQHDLSGAQNLLVANRWTKIRLLAEGKRIAVERDGKRLFEFTDERPYTSGWFALRTTRSHIRYRNIRIAER